MWVVYDNDGIDPDRHVTVSTLPAALALANRWATE